MDYEITPEEVKVKLDAAESFTLLDVREPWEFETARIDGAKLMPMGECSVARASGTRSRGTYGCALPSWCSIDECHRMAAAAGI